VKPKKPHHRRQGLIGASQYKALGIHKLLKSCPALQLEYTLLRARVKDSTSVIFIYISEKSSLQLPIRGASREKGQQQLLSVEDPRRARALLVHAEVCAEHRINTHELL